MRSTLASPSLDGYGCLIGNGHGLGRRCDQPLILFGDMNDGPLRDLINWLCTVVTTLLHFESVADGLVVELVVAESGDLELLAPMAWKCFRLHAPFP